VKRTDTPYVRFQGTPLTLVGCVNQVPPGRAGRRPCCYHQARFRVRPRL